MVLLGFGLILVRLTIETASCESPISENISLTISLSSFICNYVVAAFEGGTPNSMTFLSLRRL